MDPLIPLGAMEWRILNLHTRVDLVVLNSNNKTNCIPHVLEFSSPEHEVILHDFQNRFEFRI